MFQHRILSTIIFRVHMDHEPEIKLHVIQDTIRFMGGQDDFWFVPPGTHTQVKRAIFAELGYVPTYTPK